MTRYLKILANKYFIASLAFFLLMLFFDQNDWFTQRRRVKELREVEGKIEHLRSESARMNKELDALSRPEQLEKLAREKYHEKRDGEDVYIIVTDTVKAPAE